MSDIIINPAMQTPQLRKMGVVIGNVFVPTMQILGILNRCWLQGTTYKINSCGEFAEYIFTGVVGLNSNGKCAEIIQEQKTTTPELDISSLITTQNVVTYWGDVQVIDSRTGEIDSIYRCNFTTGEVFKIRVDGYVTPEYQLMPNGKTLQTAYDFKEMVDSTGKAHLACYSDTNIFYVKRYCYSGVSYSVSGDGDSYGYYQDKYAGLMNDSENYIIDMFDNDRIETVTYTASYTGWHYYVCAPYSGGNWESGAGLDITWTITSGTQPTE